ncbi:MAG: helix-hairpin-helix domain-containing protein [Myxococcota bacterium]
MTSISLLVSLLSSSSVGHARVYPTEIYADNEDELRFLYDDGLLEPDQFDTLVELLYNPLDINSASRGELFDLPQVTILAAKQIVEARKESPFVSIADLSRVESLTPAIIEQIKPFIRVGSGRQEQLSGYGRLRTTYYFEQTDVIENDHRNRTHTPDQLGLAESPATELKIQARYKNQWEAGVVGLAQPGIQRLEYNPESRDFGASWGTVARLGRLYLTSERSGWSFIVGSYSAGFGLGLTFDRTDRTQPLGFYKDMSVTADELYRRFRLPRRLNGAAARFSLYGLGSGELDITTFVSADRYDVYQYHMGMTGGEEVDWSQEELESPKIYIDGQKVGWMNVPNAYREIIAGTNLTYKFGTRSLLGVTAYGAHQDRDVIDGVEDDLQFVIRRDFPVLTDTYGAVGLNGAIGAGIVDVFAEGAVTFTGGAGGLVKALVNPPGGELEFSLRHYGTDFDNPHARGLAAADQYLGMRDRNEQGARFKGYYFPIDWLKVQTTVDYWRTLDTQISNLQTYGRLQASPVPFLTWSLYGQITDQNLAARGRGREYGGSFDDLYDDYGTFTDDGLVLNLNQIDFGELVERSGTRSFAGTQVSLGDPGGLQLSALYQRIWTDAGLLYPTDVDGVCEYWYQIGQFTWFQARYTLFDPTRITARIRYRDEDVVGSRGLHQLDSFIQLDQKLGERFKLVVRGFVGWDLPDPDSGFGDYCDNLGAPDLNGSCVVTEQVEGIEETAETFGYVWAMLQMRF